MTVTEKPFDATPLLAEVPDHGWQKVLFKVPLQVWRMGLKFMLPPTFACITTEGRKSGLPRHTMVEHAKISDKYYIVSGWEDKSDWVQNLKVNPQITIQPAHGKLAWGTVQRVEDESTLRKVFDGMKNSPMWTPWLESMEIEPTVDAFVAKKDQLYIYEITPTDNEIVLPPLEQNRRWMMWVVVALLAMVGRARFRARRSKQQQ